MALSSKSSSFARANAIGAQAVTGVGFQPKLVILFESSGSQSAGAIGSRFTLGATDGTNQFTVSTRSRDNVGTSVTAHLQDSTFLWSEVATNTNTQITNEAVITSLDSDGFTVTWNVATAGTEEYFCLGGSDISVKVGKFDMNGSTGNQAVTGVGFLPKAVLFFNTIDDLTEGVAANTQLTIGAAVSSSARWASSFFDDDFAATMITADYITASSCISKIDASAVTMAADLVSLDSDGFTINVTTALNATVQYIALGGNIQAAVGVTQQPATAIDVSVTGVGFQPTCAFFAGVGTATLDTVTDVGRINWGVVDSALGQDQLALSCRDNNTTSATRKMVVPGDCIGKIQIAGTTQLAAAQMQSFDSDGFTLNWSVADAEESRHGFLALAAASVAYTPRLALLGVGI